MKENNILKYCIDKLESVRDVSRTILKGEMKNYYISPFSGSSKSFLISRLIQKENQIVVLLPDLLSVSEFFVEMHLLGFEKNLLEISEFNIESIQDKLTEISKRNRLILITTYDILNCKFPLRSTVEEATTIIQVGGNLTYNDLLEYLNLLNYQKDKFVEAPGDYSQRGSIIDFWSYSERSPVRLEFDGDFLESIRYFDPDSQRSIEMIESVTLAALLNGSSMNETANDDTIFDYLINPLIFASVFELTNLKNHADKFFHSTSTPPLINDDIYTEDFSISESQLISSSENMDSEEFNSFNPEDFIYLPNTRWVLESELKGEADRIELGLTDAPPINSNYNLLYSVLTDYLSKDYNVLISSENELQSERLKDLLTGLDEKISGFMDAGKLKIETFPIKKGFDYKEGKFLLLTDYQIFNKPYRTKISTATKYKKAKSKSFNSIKKGDYVVHEDYGIGKYFGLETIRIGEVSQESMKILYNEGGVVYVNLNYLSLVKKYSASDASGGKLTPTLSTLGTSDWLNTKQKAKRRIKEAARELIELYAKRKATKGFSFSLDSVWQKELEASFLYEDTPDQSKVTEEVKVDMEAENPMDRLVCGDVGFGKTEIAVRAAFKAAQEGKQTALLVPTTILAEQHFNTFKDRLTQFPVRVLSISRFQSKKNQNEILKELREGKIDIIIGTHRLLSQDIQFKDLGLLIIDEEHRFGVMAKEKLRSLKLNVDTLTLTATPIPRTLNLSLLGARDLSIIGTPPPNRQPIYTMVSTFDIQKIREWILNEVKRGGQIYFVHDRVRSIDKLAVYLQRYIPEIKIGIAHGQMKPSQLENVIHSFLIRNYDLLLSTKIIESGIDIPNVNTIIVNRADRFGLAELHQLRGRVGRSDRQAYAYFIVPSLNGINKKALRRLQAIEEYTEIGSGFNLSMRDLEIRGAGNLLGTEQSGFINEIGFDLYIKLINEAVEELKYSEFKELFKSLPKQKERSDPSIDTYFEIGIPSVYMPEQSDRLNFYTALYSISSPIEIQELLEEMIDRFGTPPLLVKRLIATAELKHYASLALFERIIIQRKNIFIILPPGSKEDYYKYKFVEMMRFIMDNYKDTIKLNQQKETMRLLMQNNFESPEKLLKYLIDFIKQIVKLFNPG